MKRLIVNADDLGLSPGVNEGVFQAADKGCVRSTTALSGAPFFKEGLEKISTLDQVSVGVHLNLTGVWDGPENKDHPCFFTGSPGALLGACVKGGADLDHAEGCLRQQIEAFLDTGHEPTHLDGHHHVHVFPGIAQRVAALAKEYRIPKARLPRESWGSIWACKGTLVKRLVIRRLSSKAARHFKGQGILCPDQFFGFGLMGEKDYNRRFIRLLRRVKEGVSEIMTHPGVKEQDGDQDSLPSDARAMEHGVLLSPDTLEIIKSLGIELASYADLE